MSVKPAPIKFQKTFNINNYVQSGSSLLNSGNQRLNGNLQITGDEITYGSDTSAKEPLVLTVSDPSTLVANNLITKSYFDSKLNPQVYTFGAAYDNSLTAPVIQSGYVYVNFRNTASLVDTFYLRAIYKITYANANTTISPSNIADTFFDATYFIKVLKLNGVPSIYVKYLAGTDIRTAITSSQFNQSFTPLTIGRTGNRVIVSYGFPSNRTAFTNTTNKFWVSSYGITLNIMESTEEFINNMTGTNGNCYFSIS